MTCRQVREYLHRSGSVVGNLENLPPEIAAHLTSCTGCLAERRVVWLMHLGSGAGTGSPAPGFEDRLRQQLSSDPAASGARRAAGEPAGWEIFADLARPALAAAAVVTVLAMAAYVAVQTGYYPGGGADLSLLARGDARAESILDEWGAGR